MMRVMKKGLRKFRKDESGFMVVEFALAIPLIFTMFMTSVELGIYTTRQMFLDRGMEMTIRLVRLNTARQYTHNELKDMICEFSGFLPDCNTRLRLEMNEVNMRAFTGFQGTADCVDTSEPITPLRTFSRGSDHSVMLMRGCYMFDPVFRLTGLGEGFTKNGAGHAKMVSVAAFVQEPR
ncbi:MULTISPECIES: TadE/TadG family type IV pilus assembly protein [Roseobacteraceae]|uniref:Pilus biosynthesis protein TadE n=1 Tax=Pseudosulfitobacter pseudonitzschiae TaxID=1402135 RepID=A0A221K3C5_9RHOB|nr:MULTISPECIES: TadE/TadG family type IV pilus assembly protein [Roseobacteraceae]ASM73337.1 pilus biosynthesis protein TadE [Pseudosulfitobacter pseudonitzschiae]